MFTNRVFANSLCEHHPATNTNMFTNMDNPEIAVVTPYILIKI